RTGDRPRRDAPQPGARSAPPRRVRPGQRGGAPRGERPRTARGRRHPRAAWPRGGTRPLRAAPRALPRAAGGAGTVEDPGLRSRLLAVGSRGYGFSTMSGLSEATIARNSSFSFGGTLYLSRDSVRIRTLASQSAPVIPSPLWAVFVARPV